MFDRFDICEGWFVWAHDWGEYECITRLAAMGFRASPLRQSYEYLEDNAKDVYDALNARSEEDPDWYQKAREARYQRELYHSM